jgi:hypothetical protein
MLWPWGNRANDIKWDAHTSETGAMADHPIPSKSQPSTADAPQRDAKAERLADALRANLKRRKAAGRARLERAAQEEAIGGAAVEHSPLNNATPGDD